MADMADRAERLNDRIDRLIEQGEPLQEDERQDPMLQLSEALREVLVAARPAPEFRERLKAELLERYTNNVVAFPAGAMPPAGGDRATRRGARRLFSALAALGMAAAVAAALVLGYAGFGRGADHHAPIVAQVGPTATATPTPRAGGRPPVAVPGSTGNPVLPGPAPAPRPTRHPAHPTAAKPRATAVRAPTMTPRPPASPVTRPTATPAEVAIEVPSDTPTPLPTSTEAPATSTPTPAPPSSTPPVPTATAVPATDTPLPTGTPVPPTSTPLPPTETPAIPTATSAPSATAVPTETAVPTDTAAPPPTLTPRPTSVPPTATASPALAPDTIPTPAEQPATATPKPRKATATAVPPDTDAPVPTDSATPRPARPSPTAVQPTATPTQAPASPTVAPPTSTPTPSGTPSGLAATDTPEPAITAAAPTATSPVTVAQATVTPQRGGLTSPAGQALPTATIPPGVLGFPVPAPANTGQDSPLTSTVALTAGYVLQDSAALGGNPGPDLPVYAPLAPQQSPQQALAFFGLTTKKTLQVDDSGGITALVDLAGRTYRLQLRAESYGYRLLFTLASPSSGVTATLDPTVAASQAVGFLRAHHLLVDGLHQDPTWYDSAGDLVVPFSQQIRGQFPIVSPHVWTSISFDAHDIVQSIDARWINTGAVRIAPRLTTNQALAQATKGRAYLLGGPLDAASTVRSVQIIYVAVRGGDGVYYEPLYDFSGSSGAGSSFDLYVPALQPDYYSQPGQ